MKTLLLLFATAVLLAAETSNPPVATAQPMAMSSQDAIAMLSRLPDPQTQKQVADFFAGASSEDAGRVLMHIAIAAIRPARPLVVSMLSHQDPQVIDKALRALGSIGYGSTATREQIERLVTLGKPAVAIQAAVCLGAGDDLRAVPALITRLSQGPAEVGGACLAALQRLTRVDFKNDTTAWEAWYRSYRAEADQRLAVQSDLLGDPDQKKQIAAIQALAGMRGERQEALDLIEPMSRVSDQAVVMVARQALATLAPSDYQMPSAAEVVAATRPAVETTAAASATGVIGYLVNRGFFDTWYGLLLTCFTGILVLSGILFLLRTGPVKNATRRFGRVVIAGTVRFVRPATERLHLGTKRIIRSFTQNKPDATKKPN